MGMSMYCELTMKEMRRLQNKHCERTERQKSNKIMTEKATEYIQHNSLSLKRIYSYSSPLSTKKINKKE